MFLVYNHGMARKIFWFSAVVFCALFAAYTYSLYAGYFFIFWWWDLPMHFLGGILAGLIGAWLFAVRGRRPAFFAAFLGALVLGIGVESAEYLLGFTYSPWMSYPVDVIKDLILDLVGGSFVGYLLSKI